MDCPAIINQSLQGHPLIQHLSDFKFKIKMSSTTEENSVIIPTSAVAFLILSVGDVIRDDVICPDDVNDWLDKTMISKITKFSSGHRNAYVILFSRHLSENEVKVHQCLQQRFLDDRVSILVALGAKNCCDVICSVSRQFNRKFANDAGRQLREATSQRGINFEQSCRALSQSGLNEENCKDLIAHYGSLSEVILKYNS
uniref:Uncharacterized protein n=1 Tax=Ciona savignyi TaxID=51511 RepID=H2Y8S6_CIOSA